MNPIAEKKTLPVGVGVALLAGLFGASTPFAKLLLGEVSPMSRLKHNLILQIVKCRVQ